MKITIITPTYNAAKTLSENIESVKAQKGIDIDHILVDGCSNDNTIEVAKKYKNHFKKIIIEPDRGIYDAMNKGVLSAETELVGILNADDKFLPGALIEVLKVCEQHDISKTIVYGDMYVSYRDSRAILNGDLSRGAIRSMTMAITHPTIFVSKSIYRKIGLFDEAFQSGADRDFVYRADQQGIQFVSVNKLVADFSFGGTTSKFSLVQTVTRTGEEYRLMKKYFGRLKGSMAAVKVFLRMVRNYLAIKFFGVDNFLERRVRRMASRQI